MDFFTNIMLFFMYLFSGPVYFAEMIGMMLAGLFR